MTPKQKYDERKKLRIENDLRQEQRRKAQMDREDVMDEKFNSLVISLGRIADVMELWADQQKEADLAK